ncbi:MAG: GntR family transcriptional regulator [Candidatus Brocadiia bacterium]
MADATVREVIRSVELDEENGLPLAQRVADKLDEMIQVGQLEPGQKLPPTGELAELLGISRQVTQDALRALADRRRVRRKPRLGTMVLERPFGKSIGLLAAVAEWLPLQANFGYLMLQEFIRIAGQRDFDHREYITVRPSKGSPHIPQSVVADVRAEKIDVLLVGAITPSRVERALPSDSVPVILLEGNPPEVDHPLEDAARWLWREGCETVGTVRHGGEGGQKFEDRLREACSDFQLTVPDEHLFPNPGSSIEDGRKIFDKVYGRGGDTPDGMIVQDDMLAYGLIEEARDRNYPLDYSRTVVMVNKGSSLPLPAECPKIELDWGVVIEQQLDRLERESGETSPPPGDYEIHKFRPPRGNTRETVTAETESKL